MKPTPTKQVDELASAAPKVRNRAGRNLLEESRAAELKQALIQWQALPDQERPSLRQLARQLNTSHQLLGYFVRRMKIEEQRYIRTQAQILRWLFAQEMGLIMTKFVSKRRTQKDRDVFRMIARGDDKQTVLMILGRLVKKGKLPEIYLRVYESDENPSSGGSNR